MYTMVDVCELTKFAASGKALRLVMDIAAALERYKIAMEGPEGVRLRKLNRIRTIRGMTAIEGNTLTEDRVLALLARNPKLTFAGMVAALGISRSAIQKHVAHLKDAQRLRRIGPDKGGRWEVAEV